ncbi:hypothetical protein [Nocardioides pyridinolyticus]
MPGPEERRLIQALNGIMPGRAGGGAQEWDECAEILVQLGQRLHATTMPIPPGEAGAQTAQAMDTAFKRSATAMIERAEKLRHGVRALRDAQGVMEDARTAYETLGPETSGPGEFRSTADPKSPEYITAKQQHGAAEAAHLEEQQRRERVSKHWADQLDATFTKSAGTMREIHGEPPPPPPPSGYQGSHRGVSAPGGGVGGHTAPSGGGVGTPGGRGEHHLAPTGGDVGTPGGSGGEHNLPPTGSGGTPQGTPLTPYDPGTPGGTTTVGGTTGGGVSPAAGLGVAGAAGGAAAGGIIGAGLATGGLRGAITPALVNPGTAASGVRGIGATSRTGVSGALGRPAGVSGTPGAGAASSGTAARSGSAARSGVGAARSGAASAGSRGSAGGRGTGAAVRGAGARGSAAAGGGVARRGGVAGRGGRGKDEERRGQDDPFEAPEDWVGEDEASPAILD